jgi:hypothetical protein
MKGVTESWVEDSSEPNNFVMQCSFKPLTIMCCHLRRQGEANTFHVLSMASGRGSTNNF